MKRCLAVLTLSLLLVSGGQAALFSKPPGTSSSSNHPALRLDLAFFENTGSHSGVLSLLAGMGEAPSQLEGAPSAGGPLHPPDPVQALNRLAGATGVDGTLHPSALDRLEGLEDPKATSLAYLVAAYQHMYLTARSSPLDLHDLEALHKARDERVQERAPGPHPGRDRPHREATVPDSTVAALERVQTDLNPLRSARATLLEATARFAERWKDQATGADPILDLCPLIGLDLAGEDSRYERDCLLIVDVGGDDVYPNNAGGSNVALPGFHAGAAPAPCSLARFNPPPEPPALRGRQAAALIDLSGNDTYGSLSNPRSCGANGGGFLGAGFLADLGGDDAYHATGQGVNGGASSGGLGLLVDIGGSDDYEAVPAAGRLETSSPSGGSEGVNGGGNLGGMGLLVDVGGDDVYLAGVFGEDRFNVTGSLTAGSYGVNGGGSLGVGALLDVGGNDTYRAGLDADTIHATGEIRAASDGVNGGGSIGEGHLYDGGGRDRYTARLVAKTVNASVVTVAWAAVNGGANGYGAGQLVDAGQAADRYTAGLHANVTRAVERSVSAGEAGVNGGAFGDAVGLLRDAGGDDEYRVGLQATELVSAWPVDVAITGINGGAWGGSGALVDEGGNDTYRAVLEASNVTVTGDDWWVFAGTLGVNGGGAVQGAGALLEASGDDRYEAGLVTDRVSVAGDLVSGSWGVNGGGYTGGAGRLLDGSGDDVYRVLSVRAPGGITGETTERRQGVNGGGFQGVGLLVDLGGTDRFDDATGGCDDEPTRTKGTAGSCHDVSAPRPSAVG